MRLGSWALLFVCLCGLAPHIALAAPANDNFASAFVITGLTSTVTGSNVGASKQGGEPNHAGNSGGRSVWWNWTAPRSGPVSIDTIGSTFDTLLGVYTGTQVSALTTIAADNNSGGGLASRVVFNAATGITYRIAVDGFSGAAGNIVLHLKSPANDLFVDAVRVGGTNLTLIGHNEGATLESGEPQHGEYSSDKSVWWRWTAPTNGLVTLDNSGSDFDPVLEVYSGDSVFNISLAARAETSFYPELYTRLIFYALAGTNYPISAASHASINVRTNHNIVLNLRQQPMRINDMFADRIQIAGISNSAAGNNIFATKQSGEPDHAGDDGGKSLWWTWTAPTNCIVTVDTVGSSFDTLLAVYTGVAISNLALVASNDDREEDRTSSISFRARSGSTYQIAVDGWMNTGGYILLNLRAVPVPPNDLFADRILITGVSNTVAGYTTGATAEPGEWYSGPQSTWWTWIAPAYGEVAVTVTGADGRAYVFTGDSISNLVLAPSSTSGFFAAAGTPYQISVSGSGSYTLSIAQASPPATFQIVSQPQNGSQSLGYPATLSVGVAGVAPLFFRWYKDGSAIPEGTNMSYTIERFTTSDTGVYRVTVSDGSRTIISSNAVLTLWRQPPDNDDFANRFVITGSAITVTGISANATLEIAEPNHGNRMAEAGSVWWTWTAPANTTASLEMAGGFYGVVLAVYVGNSLSQLTPVANSGLFSSTVGRISFAATAGVAYHIAVVTFYDDITFNLRTGPPPVNDNFGTAISISGTNKTLTGSNLDATKEQGEPMHAGNPGGKSVWWTWVAPTNGVVTIDTLGSSFDTLLAIYTGTSVTNLIMVASSDEDGTNHIARLTFFGRSGVTYQIAVDGFNGLGGNIVLNLRQTLSPFAPLNIEFKGNWPGFRNGVAYDVAAAGTVLYAAIGQGGILILDASDAENPRRIGTLAIPGDVQRVIVADGYAYLGVRNSGVYIVDIRNPALSSIVGIYDGLTNVNQIAVKGNYAFVADRTAGFAVLNIAQKSTPTYVGGLPSPALSVSIDGNYAYVCEGGNGLRIVNITSPGNLVTTSMYTVPATDGGLYASSVTVSNGYAFVLNANKLHVVAITNVYSPFMVSETHAVSFFVHLPMGNIWLEDGIVYMALRGSEVESIIRRIDVRNPAAPQAVVPDFGAYALTDLQNVNVANGYVFAANGAQGIAVFQSSSRLTSPVTAFYTAPKAFGLAAQGNTVYLANGLSGVQIVDITSPSVPTLVGTVPGAAYSVVSLGANIAVGALGPPPRYNGSLDIFDVARPATPIGVNSIQGTAGLYLPLAYALGPNRLYMLSGFDTVVMTIPRDEYFSRARAYSLSAFDVTEAAQPVLLESDDNDFADQRARSFAVAGGCGFFPGDCGQCIRIVDLNDHARRYTQPTFGTVRALAASQNRLVAAEGNAIEVFDITFPTKPTLLGRFTRVGEPGAYFSDVAIAGQRIAAVDPSDGVYVIDGSTANLVEIGRYPAIGCEKVMLAGNYALVTQGPQGLSIFDLGPTFAAAPSISFQPRSQRVLKGSNVRFDVGVNGTVPIHYQWQVNGSDIPGATNFVLDLANVQFGHEGSYTVVVSNAVGVTITSNAVLSVDRPPSIQIVMPVEGQIFYAPATVTVSNQVFDSDGTVASVSFYLGSTLLGVATNAPYLITTPSLSVGTYVLGATATDNEGATTVSAPVTITVTNVRVFQFSQPQYDVNESNIFATVTVFRNFGGFATVNYATLDGSARSVSAGRIGQYNATAGTLLFGPSVLTRTIQIQIVDDLVNRGPRDFLVQLSAPSAGWFLASPTNALVTILDNDFETNNIFTDVVSPAAAPAGRGSLKLTLEPPAVLGRWRFWWETAWRESGSVATNLIPGDYRVQFMPRSGFIKPAESNYNVIAGVPLSRTNFYLSNLGGKPGAVRFTLRPEPIVTGLNGQWRLQGHSNTNWQNSGDVLDNLPEGAYLAEFKPIGGGYLTPAAHVVEVLGGETMLYATEYIAPEIRQGSVPRSLDSFATVTNPSAPYQFNGQIITDGGYGSGFVVKPRTVLTAAHVVFDSARLTYMDTVLWFFQRHHGDFDPPPLEPRGWYVFEGYASGRTNDIAAGYAPGESSIESRNLDVAALYFLTNAARGGYGGYLTTTAESDWLNMSAFKLLLGYPVDHVAEKDRGRLHQSGPMFSPLDRITNQVFRTDQLFGFGGDSGGPLCVLSMDSLGRSFFIPAGVYLGDDAETYVRAIDIDVVDLVNRAEASGNGGGNSTGGGVITVSFASASTLTHAGFLEVSIGPPAAVRLGGKWRVSPTNYGELGELHSYTNYTANPYKLAVRSRTFDIQVKNLPGFITPDVPPVTIPEGGTAELPLKYSVPPPRLFFDRQRGLGITGTPQTVYQIQAAPSLARPINWTTQNSITLGPGTNWLPAILPAPTTNRFYRLRWVSD